MREYDYLVFIGRFQPLHNGHIRVIEHALQQADRVIVLVGSANLARSPRNPFTFSERRKMIEGALIAAGVEPRRVIIRPIGDYPYNDAAWIGNVQNTIESTVLAQDNPSPSVTLHGLKDYKVGLIGHQKDYSSYYLKLFPEWRSVPVPNGYGVLSATDIREMYLRRAPQMPGSHLVPNSTLHFLHSFMMTEHFKWLVAEQEFYANYRKSWEGTPFPPFINCVDAVVVQAGHILLVRRGAHPGRGLLALPGGHPNAREPFRDAVIRELREETRISDGKGEIPPAMLASFIEDAKTRLFDDPHRSERGRVVTQAYHFVVPNRNQLLTVRGDDDAEGAVWHQLGSLRSTDFFEDHAAIITEMTGYSLTTDWEV
jgi:bifunctional NMN adenylyltransferase/nudix hydrolase